MPKFTTVSPTCLAGGKPAAWERFLHGNYIAIGWCYKTDLSGKSIDQILKLIPGTSGDDQDEKDGIYSFPIFWELAQRGAANAGDLIGVKNTNHGLFGIGRIISGYKYSRKKHDTGVKGHYYPHYLEVEWLHTDYILRSTLDFGDEPSWRPFGTLGQLYNEIPACIRQYTGTGVRSKRRRTIG